MRFGDGWEELNGCGMLSGVGRGKAEGVVRGWMCGMEFVVLGRLGWGMFRNVV